MVQCTQKYSYMNKTRFCIFPCIFLFVVHLSIELILARVYRANFRIFHFVILVFVMNFKTKHLEICHSSSVLSEWNLQPTSSMKQIIMKTKCYYQIFCKRELSYFKKKKIGKTNFTFSNLLVYSFHDIFQNLYMQFSILQLHAK